MAPTWLACWNSTAIPHQGHDNQSHLDAQGGYCGLRTIRERGVARGGGEADLVRSLQRRIPGNAPPGTQDRSWQSNVYVKIPITNTRRESAVPLIRELSRRGREDQRHRDADRGPGSRDRGGARSGRTRDRERLRRPHRRYRPRPGARFMCEALAVLRSGPRRSYCGPVSERC